MPRGSTFGVIGENGSGKSTLLKLVSGITKPTRGTLLVDGRVSALIELGAGFHPEISGRENVVINGIMLGLTRKEVDRRFDEIVEFAELRDFIDAPVKTYSSGMYMRLGFAVAIHVDPDVLLIDEVLAVGDEAFTRKCLDKIAEFHRRGKTILFVTHTLGLVEKMCDDALWLRHGKAVRPRRPQARRRRVPHLRGRRRGRRAGGRAGRARWRPRRAEGAPGGESVEGPPEGSEYRAGRWGSRAIEIRGPALPRRPRPAAPRLRAWRDGHGRARGRRARAGRGLRVRDRPLLRRGHERLRHEHRHRGVRAAPPVRGDAEVRLVLEGLSLVEGTYLLDVAAHRRDGTPYDYHRGLHSLRVKSRLKDVGLYRPAHHWSFSGGDRAHAPRAAERARPRGGAGRLSPPAAVPWPGAGAILGW